MITAVIAWLFSGGPVTTGVALQRLGLLPLGYSVNASDQKLLLNEKTELTVTAHYYDGSNVTTSDLACSFVPSPPDVFGLSLPQDCKGLSIINSESNFANKGKPVGQIDVTITTQVHHADSLSARWFGEHTTQTRISLLNQTEPVILADSQHEQSGQDITLRIGDTVQLRADFPKGIRPSQMRCEWFQEGAHVSPFQDSPTCDHAVYPAPKTVATPEMPAAKITLEISDPRGQKIGSANVYIRFDYPHTNFSALVIDTSTRMGLNKFGHTLFDEAKRQIEGEISHLNYQGGWLSLTAFGGDGRAPVSKPDKTQDGLARDDSPDCGGGVANAPTTTTDQKTTVPAPAVDSACPCSQQGVHQLYPLRPFSLQDAQTGAKELTLGQGDSAPLGLAIRLAAKPFGDKTVLEHTKYPVDNFYFVMLTAGGDTCTSTPLQSVFDDLRGIFTNEDALSHIYLDSQLLAAVIATPLSQYQKESIWYSNAYRDENTRAVLFAPQTPEELVGILNDFSVLANVGTPQKQRVRACDDLVMQVQYDEEGRHKLNLHCDRIRRR